MKEQAAGRERDEKIYKEETGMTVAETRKSHPPGRLPAWHTPKQRGGKSKQRNSAGEASEVPCYNIKPSPW